MKRLIWLILVMSFMVSSAFAQSNKIVLGPLVGDDAGVLTVLNSEEIEIEVWVRTDPQNPVPFTGVAHALMSEDAIIAERNGAQLDPDYDTPNWEQVVVDGPFVHDPDWPYPIPVGNTCEIQWAVWVVWNPPVGDPLDTQGEWDYYGAFLMTCNTDVPIEETYYPFSMGWYPHTGQGTVWAFDAPPGGWVVPEQDYCGLYFVPECDYFHGDCNHNGVPWQLSDVVAIIAYYRGWAEPSYTCYCPPNGDDYPPGADPNGNCIPYELADVVYMIQPYDDWPPFGCPDCPASEGLLKDQAKDQ